MEGREAKGCIHNEERQSWRLKGSEGKPEVTTSPKAMVSCCPVLPVKVMFGLVALQQKGLLPTSVRQISLVWAATGGHVDI